MAYGNFSNAPPGLAPKRMAPPQGFAQAGKQNAQSPAGLAQGGQGFQGPTSPNALAGKVQAARPLGQQGSALGQSSMSTQAPPRPFGTPPPGAQAVAPSVATNHPAIQASMSQAFAPQSQNNVANLNAQGNAFAAVSQPPVTGYNPSPTPTGDIPTYPVAPTQELPQGGQGYQPQPVPGDARRAQMVAQMSQAFQRPQTGQAGWRPNPQPQPAPNTLRPGQTTQLSPRAARLARG